MTDSPAREGRAAGPGRLGSADALRIIFDLSFGQMLWSRRSLFLLFLVGAPVTLAAIVRLVLWLDPSAFPRADSVAVAGPTIFGVIVWASYVRFIVPVLGVFYGTALIADEVEQKTITYLFTRPIRRGAVLLGKYLAYLACTLLLVLPSAVLVYLLVVPLGGGSIGRSFPSLLADLGMIVVGLAAYGAVFAFVGARLKRPLVVGLVFVFGWEPAVLLFPGYLKRWTVGYYLQALVPHAMPQDSAVAAIMRVFADVPPVVVSLGVLTALTLGFLWLAGRTVEVREYVLEQ
jgi:ABC-type Na+ efflux pump permease subunit